MFSRWIIVIGMGLGLPLMTSSCGYDGKYRYPCQDPVNWESPDCQPPLCTPTGTCTDTLVYGEDNA